MVKINQLSVKSKWLSAFIQPTPDMSKSSHFFAHPGPVKNFTFFPRADGAKRRARVLIPPGYLHPEKRKH
jgi:hypothetical protein